MIWHVRRSTAADAPAALAIWRAATGESGHDFLSVEDRAAIDAEVAAMLPGLAYDLAAAEDGQPLAFMIAEGDTIDALFVAPAAQGRGIGRSMVERFAAGKPVVRLDVNEANVPARSFYEGIGFTITGRSERDGQGRPYPLLHLERRS